MYTNFSDIRWIRKIDHVNVSTFLHLFHFSSSEISHGFYSINFYSEKCYVITVSPKFA